MEFKLPVSREILGEVSKIDHFQGVWSGQQSIPTDRLPRLAEAARVQSAGSSARLAGMRVSDADVSGLLRGEAVRLADANEIVGYATTLSHLLPGRDRLLTTDELRRIHGKMVGASGPSPFRTKTLHREAFDSDGKALGRVFSTLPARMVEQKTDEALTWLEFELRAGEQHPVLVIGTFALLVISICPFDRGNGRLSRLLANLLLRRAGYGSIPYASLESQLEQSRNTYFTSIAQAQTGLWSGESDLEPWLALFLQVLGQHRERVEAKIEVEREAQDYPPLQQAILSTVREHGTVDAALLISATGANRNTLKDNLRRLVQRGVLVRTGQRRGTRYHMATGERPLELEH